MPAYREEVVFTGIEAGLQLPFRLYRYGGYIMIITTLCSQPAMTYLRPVPWLSTTKAEEMISKANIIFKMCVS